MVGAALALAGVATLAGCARRTPGSPASVATCVARLGTDAAQFARDTLPPLRPAVDGAVAWASCDGHAALVAAVERVTPLARTHAGRVRAALEPGGPPIDPETRAWLAGERFDDFARAARCDRFDLPPLVPGSLSPGSPLRVAPVVGVSSAIAARAVMPETPVDERRRLGITLALLASDLQRGNVPSLVAVSERLLVLADTVLRPTLGQAPAFTPDQRAELRAAVAAQASPWRVIAVEYAGAARGLSLAREPAFAQERFHGRTPDDAQVGEACDFARARLTTLRQSAAARPDAYRDVLGRFPQPNTTNPVTRAFEPAYATLTNATERLAAAQARLRDLAARALP